MRNLVRGLLLVGALGLISCSGGGSSSAEPGGEFPGWLDSAGPHAVGVRFLALRDTSRNFGFQGEFSAESADFYPARPLPTLLWYPRSTGGRIITYSRYSELTQRLDEQSVEALPAERIAESQLPNLRFVYAEVEPSQLEESMRGYLETTAVAREEAPHAAGPFPLVLLASSSGHSNPILAEYLASHGYVVASIRSLGKYAASYMEFAPNPTFLETQSRDIASVVGQLQAEAWVDSNHLAVGGFSIGSVPPLLFQMQTWRAAALFSIEGHDRYSAGSGSLFQVRDYDPRAVRVPLLYLQADAGGFSRQTDIFEALEYADRWILDYPELKHHQFLSDITAGGPASDSVLQAYAESADLLRKFLDKHLKPSQNRASWPPSGPLTDRLQHFEARQAVPTVPELWILLQQPGGVERATDIMREARSEDPERQLFPESILDRLGNRLMRSGGEQLEDAIAILGLVVEAYDSPASWSRLADAYERAERTGEALQASRKALERISPETPRGDRLRQANQDRIERLEGAGSEGTPR